MLGKPVNFDLLINAISNALHMEEVESNNIILAKEKDYLIELFSDFVIKCQNSDSIDIETKGIKK